MSALPPNIAEETTPNALHVRHEDLVLLISPQQLQAMLEHMAIAPNPYDFTSLGKMKAIRIDVDLTGITPEKARELMQFIEDDPLA